MGLNVIVKVFDIGSKAEDISRAVNLERRDQRDWLSRTIYWAARKGKLVQVFNVEDERQVNDTP